MLHLPNEVLVYVLRNLYHVNTYGEEHGDKNDILAARSVCRRLADIGALFAFSHLHVTQEPKGFDKLYAVTNSCHRSHVRLLTYSFEDFSHNIVPEADVFEYMAPDYGEIDLSKYRPDLYEDYHQGSMYQFHLHRYDIDVSYLAAAFGLLRNLQSIRISQELTPRTGPLGEDWLLPLDCPSFLQLATSYRILDTISVSLIAAAARIKTLTLVSSPSRFGDRWPLIALIDGLRFSKSALYRQAFSHLEALQICLPSDDVISPVNYKGLEDFLCSLPALEELVLTGAVGEPAELRHPEGYLFVSRSRLSRLQSIQIENVTFESALHLTKFLSRHSDTLQRVALHGAVRQSYRWDETWDEPLSQIKEALKLTVVQNLRGICIFTDESLKEKSWFPYKASECPCQIYS